MVSRIAVVLSDSKLYVGWRAHAYPCQGTEVGAPHGGSARPRPTAPARSRVAGGGPGQPQPQVSGTSLGTG